MNVERRRFPRIPFFSEEAALIHAGARDIPVKLVDLSRTGLLFSFLDLSSLSDPNSQPKEPLEVSIAHNHSELRLRGRMVRQTSLAVAMEFIELREDVARKLDEKLRSLGLIEEAERAKTRSATVS